jgi:D-methionine transport system substrate-binding protein
VNNPKKLKIVEIEAPQLTRALDDKQVTMAIITLLSSRLAKILTYGEFLSSMNRPLRVGDRPIWLENVVFTYQTDEVANAAAELYKGDAVKGW